MSNAAAPRVLRLALLASLAGASAAHARLPEVVVQSSKVDVESAVTQAPTLTALNVIQPTTDISQYFIQNNLRP
jgi:hypothetical protein